MSSDEATIGRGRPKGSKNGPKFSGRQGASPWTSGLAFGGVVRRAKVHVKVHEALSKTEMRALADAAAASVPITKVPAVDQNKYLKAFEAKVRVAVDTPIARKSGGPARKSASGASYAALAVEGAPS
jgi:hypothetical protein